MASFTPVRIPLSALQSMPITDGQLILVYDTGRIFLDTAIGRFEQGITTVSDSSQLPLIPVHKLYFCRSTKKLYYYTDRWEDLLNNLGYMDVTGGYSGVVKSISGANVTMTSDSTLVDMTKYAVGDKVYINLALSLSGEFKWTLRTISAINGRVITLDQAANTTNLSDYDVSDASAGRYLLNVGDTTVHVLDAAHSIGSKNFATGLRSAALGSWNTAGGMCSVALGMYNTANGDGSVALGMSNVITHDNAVSIGGNNKVYLIMNTAIGHGNVLRNQGLTVLGFGNLVNAIGSIVVGNSNKKVTGFNSIVFGNSNLITGQLAIAVGRGLVNNSRAGILLGANGILSSDALNREAFALAGGSGLPGTDTQKVISLIHRTNRALLNPLYDPTKDTGNTGKDSTGLPKYNSVKSYRTSYRGSMCPMTQTVTVDGSDSVLLDPTMYGRVSLLGSGTAILDLPDYMQDGDRILIVVDTRDISLVLDNNWVGSPDTFALDPGLCVFLLVRIRNTTFYKVLYPDGARGSSQPSYILWYIPLSI